MKGIRILPDFNYLKDNLPLIDILFVSNAAFYLDAGLDNDIMNNFVKKASKNAQFIFSHFVAAFVLAKTELLKEKYPLRFPAN